MKKKFVKAMTVILAFSLAASALILVGCTDEKDEPSPRVLTQAEWNLLGTWRSTNNPNDLLVFNRDGTVVSDKEVGRFRNKKTDEFRAVAGEQQGMTIEGYVDHEWYNCVYVHKSSTTHPDFIHFPDFYEDDKLFSYGYVDGKSDKDIYVRVDEDFCIYETVSGRFAADRSSISDRSIAGYRFNIDTETKSPTTYVIIHADDSVVSNEYTKWEITDCFVHEEKGRCYTIELINSRQQLLYVVDEDAIYTKNYNGELNLRMARQGRL